MAQLQTIIVLLDLFILAAAAVMAYQAYKAHRALSTKSSLAFLWCFTLIAIGVIFSGLTDVVVRLAISIPLVAQFTSSGLLTSALQLAGALGVLAGYTVLLLVVERIQNKSMWLLVFVLIVFTILIGTDLFFITHVLAIILLALLTHNFRQNAMEKQNANARLVFLAFLILMVGHVASLLNGIEGLGSWPQLVFVSFRLLGYFLLYWVTWRVSHG